MAQPRPAGPRPTRAYRWLAAVPGLAMLAGAVFANRARPFVFGLPFLLFWILVWVVATAVVMAFVYRADERAARDVAPGPAAGDGAPPRPADA